MSFRRRAAGGKRDLVEPAIIQALKAYGARIWRLSGTGNPDLLVLYREHYVVMEIKTGKNKATANQRDIPWPIVRSVEDAIAVIRTTRPEGRP